MFMPSPAPQPSSPPGGGITVDVPPPAPTIQDGALLTRLDDGSLEVDLEPDSAAPGLPELAHDTNLAEVIPDEILSSIAFELCEGIEADILSNQEWHEICERGVILLGIKKENRDDVFEGASGDFHPVMLEAVLRGQANARAEMLPAGGPVRTELLATTSGASDKQQKSIRKQQWMNYYLTSVEESYYPDFDQMLMYLYIYGSTFKKVYTNPLKRRPTAPFILPKQLIMSATATDVNSCGRVTHETQMSRGDVIRMELAGIYRHVELSEPMEDGDLSIGERLEGRSREMIQGDERHTIWECHCDLDIPVEGIEHIDPRTERPSGLPLPYIVTIDRDSQQVLALRRNWDENDADFSRLQYFVHYRLMPGLGVYGWGYAHVMASTAESATKLRRCLLDSALLANFPGGFKAKGVKQEQNNLSIGPCEFRDVDIGSLTSIQAAIMPLPYKEPGPVASEILQEIVEGGQRIGNTMDMAVGDGREDAPVGTTLALIEKATRPESAIIKRLHASHKTELRLLADQFAQAPAGTVYPYKVNGQPGQALADDFADTDDIVPVSDPNISTQTQRLAIAQAKLTLASQAPQLHDMRQAYLDIYRVMGLTDADINRIMPPPQQAQPMDPVSENMAAVKGQPLAVGPTQNHAAHAQVHMAFLQMPGAPQQAIQALVAHLGDHLNAAYRQQIEAAIGQPLPPPGTPLPPQIEAALSIHAAQVAQQVTQQVQQMLGSGGQGQDPSIALGHETNQVKMADIQAKQADAERKAEESARQDELEAIKLERTLADNAAARESQERLAAMSLRETEIHAAAQAHQRDTSLAAEVIKGETTARSARLGVVAEAVKGASQVHSDKAHVLAEAVRGESAVRAEQARERTEDTKGRHAVDAATRRKDTGHEKKR